MVAPAPKEPDEAEVPLEIVARDSQTPPQPWGSAAGRLQISRARLATDFGAGGYLAARARRLCQSWDDLPAAEAHTAQIMLALVKRTLSAVAARNVYLSEGGELLVYDGAMWIPATLAEVVGALLREVAAAVRVASRPDGSLAPEVQAALVDLYHVYSTGPEEIVERVYDPLGEFFEKLADVARPE